MNLYLVQNLAEINEVFVRNKFHVINVDEIKNCKKPHLVVIVGYESEIKLIVASIRKKNINAFIAHVHLSLANIEGSDKTGIDDGLYGLELQKLDLRIKTWIEAAKFRKMLKHDEESHKNIFGASVYSRKVKFYFRQSNSLDLILDYYRNDRRFDFVWYAPVWANTCYEICHQALDLAGQGDKPIGAFQENEEYFFFTLSRINSDDTARYESLAQTIEPEYIGVIGCTYSKSNHVFALYAKKNCPNKNQSVKRAEIIKQEAEQPKQEKQINTILRRSIAGKQDSAKEYVASIDIDPDEIRDLEELERDATSDLIDIVNEEHGLQIFITFFEAYVIFLEKLEEFADLQIGVKEVMRLLREARIAQVGNISDILLFAAALKQDLSLWRTHIFVLQDTNNIHYMDASIMSSCLQISAMLNNTNIESIEVEFF